MLQSTGKFFLGLGGLGEFVVLHALSRDLFVSGRLVVNWAGTVLAALCSSRDRGGSGLGLVDAGSWERGLGLGLEEGGVAGRTRSTMSAEVLVRCAVRVLGADSFIASPDAGGTS